MASYTPPSLEAVGNGVIILRYGARNPLSQHGDDLHMRVELVYPSRRQQVIQIERHGLTNYPPAPQAGKVRPVPQVPFVMMTGKVVHLLGSREQDFRMLYEIFIQ